MDRADAVFIAVGMPSCLGDGHADLTYAMSAAEDIARALTGYAIVVTKSTVLVGTNRVAEVVNRKCYPHAEFDIASNPDFLREAAAIDDFIKPFRVVVGVENDRDSEVMADIYRPHHLREFPVDLNGLESAEMIKYAASALC